MMACPWTACLLVTTLALARSDMQAVRHKGSSTGFISLDGCPSHVSWRDAPFTNSLEPEKQSHVYWLRSLFTAKEAATLVRMILPARFSTAADSTDHLPSFELYLLGAGKPATAEPRDEARLERLRSLILPRVESCITPFLRRKFACEACLPCVSLVRRYKPTERSDVQPHRDALARVTVVVELQPADGSSPAAAARAGGLFIQTAEAAELSFVPMRAGDAFLHDFELLHGVKLACDNCARYSLVVWYREDGERCEAGGDVEGATQMYRRSAEAGVAEGRYSWSRHALQVGFDGSYEVRPDVLPPNATAAERAVVVGEAVAFLEAAATEQAHGNACVFLAELHLLGVPGALPADRAAVQRWRARARELGSTELEAWQATRAAELAEALGRQAPMLGDRHAAASSTAGGVRSDDQRAVEAEKAEASAVSDDEETAAEAKPAEREASASGAGEVRASEELECAAAGAEEAPEAKRAAEDTNGTPPPSTPPAAAPAEPSAEAPASDSRRPEGGDGEGDQGFLDSLYTWWQGPAPATAPAEGSRTPSAALDRSQAPAATEAATEAATKAATRAKAKGAVEATAGRPPREDPKLTAAIRAGNPGAVASALKRHPDAVHAVSADGWTGLHMVCQSGHTAIGRLLLEGGANADVRAPGMWTALLLAAGYGHAALVELLLWHGAAVDAALADGMSALHLAAQYGHEEVAAALLAHGGSASASTASGAAPLHLAAEAGHARMVTLLLRRGARAEQSGQLGWTALLLACQGAREEVALALLDGGASPRTSRSDGATPLHLAARYATPRLCRELLSRGAAVAAVSADGSTPLHFAAHGGQVETCSLLLAHGAPADAPTADYGFTALHVAAERGDLGVATALLRGGANVAAANGHAQTPARVARYFGLGPMSELLARHGSAAADASADGSTRAATAAFAAASARQGARPPQPATLLMHVSVARPQSADGEAEGAMAAAEAEATPRAPSSGWARRAVGVWQRQGVLVVPRLLPEAVIAPLRAHVQRALRSAGAIDYSFAIRSGGSRQLRAVGVEAASAALALLARHLQPFLDEALGTELALLECHVMRTSPGAAEQTFHSDVPHADPRLVSVQIALVDTDATQGALDAIPATHGNDDDATSNERPAIAVAVPAGSVTFYSPRLLHRGRANTHADERLFLGLSFLARGGIVPSGIPYAIEREDIGQWQLAAGELQRTSRPRESG